MKTLLVPVDGSAGSVHAARFAARLARDAGAAVELLHVYDAPRVTTLGLTALTRDEIDAMKVRVSRESFERAEEAMAGIEVPFERHVIVGDPVSEIIARAKRIDADLIVIGNRGLSPVEGLLLGSVSARVVREAGCPVTVVR